MGRILVAGGSGFIGRVLVRRLVAGGADVAVMTAHPDRSRTRIESLHANVVRGDIQHPESLPGAVEGADVVVQALTFPSFPVEKPSKGWTFEGFEHVGTERLVNAARTAGVKRFVFVSGVNVAPDAEKVWHRAKWGGEQAIIATGIPATIIRPSWVYGPEDRALNRFVTFARSSPFVPVIGDGSQRINPVFVDDVAAVLAQATALDGPTGIYEIGGPDIMTMDDILKTMLEVMGRSKPLVHFPEWMPKAGGAVARFLPKPPLSPDAVEFATATAIAVNTQLLEAFDITLTPLREGLATYLSPKP